MKISYGHPTTSQLVDKAILERAQNQPPRKYIGGSSLGKECDALIWFNYKTPVNTNDPRIQRIFDVGHALEPVVVGWLKEAGFQIYDKDENGNQFEVKDGVMQFHIDGVITGLPESKKPHLLEIKTAKHKRFEEYQKNGVEKSDPEYYGQVQVYMYKFNLERCLFVMLNKDTQDLYFERINLEKMKAKYLIERGREIGAMNERPERKYPSRDFYKCRWCAHRDTCWIDGGTSENTEELSAVDSSK